MIDRYSLPKGGIAQVYGSINTGKSMFAVKTVADAQAQGGKVAYIDTEGSLTPEKCRMFNADYNSILRSKASMDNVRETINGFLEAPESSAMDLIVLDSVTDLVTTSDGMGGLTLTMGNVCRNIRASGSKTSFLFINQSRPSLGNYGRSGDSIPGGQALSHSSDLILKIHSFNISNLSFELECIKSRHEVPKMMQWS
jgi:recombination protein RecA